MQTQITRSSAKVPQPLGKRYNAAILFILANLLVAAPSLSWAANKAPTAIVTASPISGQAPFYTTLDASESSDSDGSITAYSWKFGDGGSSTSPSETHLYTSAGTYKVSLKITDNQGATRTTTMLITVTAPPPPSVFITVPKGVYGVIGGRAIVPDSLLVNPDVEGVVLRDIWPNVEIQEGVYDWSYFDDQIARLSNADKSISLLINSGGQSTPDWVMNLDVQKFTFINKNSNQDNYNTAITIPVFWDPVFLQKKLAFIRAVGQRYASNPHVVMVDAQCGNSTTADWNVPSTNEDITEWRTLGFTSDKLLQACQQVVSATITAFPNQEVKMAVGRINAMLDTYFDPDYVSVNLLNYANSTYPGRFVAQKYNLSATTSDPLNITNLGSWQVLYDHKPNIAAQMLWFASDETSCRMNGNVKPCNAYTMLDTAVNTGINYGMQFLEIYQGDIDNPELSDIIHHAAVTLGTN